MRMIGKTTTAAVALAFAIGLAACGNNTSSSQYAGTWKTKDTGGGDFDITLAADGKATGNRPGETLTGPRPFAFPVPLRCAPRLAGRSVIPAPCTSP